MNEESFVTNREPSWQRLLRLCDKGESSPALLSPQELADFIRLYRQTSADLALARTHSTNQQLLDFLNDLTGRAYVLLYRQPRGPIVAAIKTGLQLCAQTVREAKWFVLVSVILLFGSAFFASIVEAKVPSSREFLTMPGFGELSKQWQSGSHEERSGSEAAMATSFYASNNPFVAILSGSIAAATFGVGTTVQLYNNGKILGVLANDMARVNKLGFLIVSIAPHGVTELSGMVMSGASGLTLGWALINPGRRKRGEALINAGKSAIILLIVAVILMLMAAPIEGYFSFNPRVPGAVKVVFALATAVFWGLFWTGYGNKSDTKSEPMK